MFFALSKILLFLIQPICWVFILFIASVIVKNGRYKKRLFFTALGLLWFFSNQVIVSSFAKIWDITQFPPRGKYSCAILLGGFSSTDKNGHGFFNSSSDRFIQALKLKATSQVSKIMMSGGNGQLIKTTEAKEADFVISQFREFHVPDSCILSENRSRNTLENAMYSKQVLLSNKVHGPFLLVTSAFHMRRAVYIFNKVGIKVIPYPCDFIAGNENFSIADYIIPDPYALVKWNFYLKEVVGMVAYRLKPVPTINPPGNL